MSDAPSLDALARDARRRLAAIDAFGASALPDLATSALDALRDDAPDLARGLVAAVDALRAEREARAAAEARRDALAAAVRAEREAREREVTIANEPRSARTGEEWSAAYLAATKATDAARAVVTALLSGAAPDVVRAGVVRAYLDAADEWENSAGIALVLARAEMVATRAALDAALAAVKETL